MTRYLANYNNHGTNGLFDESFMTTVGYDIGQAASINYYVIEEPNVDLQALEPHRFQLSARDYHYANLLKPMAERGFSNPVYFFFLSEALTQLNSIAALRESFYFTDLLEMKMTLASIVSLEMSLSKLSSYSREDPLNGPDAADPAKTISGIIPRERRKAIHRAKDLRNAFIHYDFISLLGPDCCRELNAEEVLNLAAQSSVEMTADELLAWLRQSRDEIARSLNELISLPT